MRSIASSNEYSIVQIRVYPRTSIDSSRRVRQLAHDVQGRIAISCGKRLARYMPDIISSWLAGQQDPDKAVSRAAHDSFKKVFATEEKFKNVWRVYRQAIAEYTENVVLHETESTLSDMRTANLDDATTKYARVAGCAVTMLASLIGKKFNHGIYVICSMIQQTWLLRRIWRSHNQSCQI